MRKATRRIILFRGLLWTLVQRELKARYRGSALGFFWSLVNPLLLLGVYTFVFNYIFKPRVEGTDPFVLFMMTGLFPWTWVASSLLEGTQSLMANAGLIRKAVFPAEILPIVSVVSNLAHFLLTVPILAGALLVGRFFGYPVGGWTALFLPIIISLQLVTLGGFALGLAGLNVHFKDVKDILINLLALLFYLTPIIYPLSWISFPVLRWLIAWTNPFTPFTTAYQQALFAGTVPTPEVWLHMGAWALVAWFGGTWLFERLSDNLAEAV